MQKNTAGQKWRVFAFNRTSNVPTTGDAANITATISIDGAALTGTNDVNPTELADGFYEFNLTQAETNGDSLLLSPSSVTSDIQVVGCPACISTNPTSWGDDVIQTGDSFARIGVAGVGLTNIGDASLATASALAIVDTVVDAILVDTGTTLPATLTTIEGKIDTVDTVADGIKVITDAMGATAAANFAKALGAASVISFAVEAGTLSTTQATTDLTEATTDHYLGRYIIWQTGVLAGQATDITAYTGSGGLLTFTALTEAPSAGDTGIIV